MPKEKMLTDEEILKALNVCRERAEIPASLVAEELGVSSRYVKDRLLEMKKKKIVDAKYRGSFWCFRPFKSS
jgi:hypothetical protein